MALSEEFSKQVSEDNSTGFAQQVFRKCARCSLLKSSGGSRRIYLKDFSKELSQGVRMTCTVESVYGISKEAPKEVFNELSKGEL